MSNAKNQVQELLAGRGLALSCAVYAQRQVHSGAWESTLVLTLPEREPLTGIGTGGRKSQADVAAAEQVLALLAAQEGEEAHDWAPVYADAQAGDALLKLAAYLSPGLSSAAERSYWLQVHESDGALARVFDRWLEQGDPELVSYGQGLGEKNKATVVEALIWRRFGARVLGPGAGDALEDLRAALSHGSPPSALRGSP